MWRLRADSLLDCWVYWMSRVTLCCTVSLGFVLGCRLGCLENDFLDCSMGFSLGNLYLGLDSAKGTMPY